MHQAKQLLYGPRQLRPQQLRPDPAKIIKGWQADPEAFTSIYPASADPFSGDSRLENCSLLYRPPGFRILEGNKDYDRSLWGQESPDAIYLDKGNGLIIVAVGTFGHQSHAIIESFESLGKAIDFLNDQRSEWSESEVEPPQRVLIKVQDIYQVLGI